MNRSSVPRRIAPLAGIVVLAALLAGPVVPVGASGVACLDARLRPSEVCPPVDISVGVAVDGDHLVVTVGNVGTETWMGGPVAVEVPVDRDPDAAGSDGSERVMRAGVAVARCVFDPVERIEPGHQVSCSVPWAGLADGRRLVWLTGFVGGLPPVSVELGDEPPAVGVVPVAASRSVRIELQGTTVRLVRSAVGPTGGVDAWTATGSNRPPWLPLAAAVAALAPLVGLWLVVGRRRGNGAS